jgi:hypothetical protein
MWEPGPAGERVDYAVVVKAGRISGSVSGRSGTTEVTTQVHQCFGSTYLDLVTNEERTVARCIVVTSGELKKEAKEAIKAVLTSSRLHLVTSLWDGDTLWERIEEHLPENSLADQMQRLQRDLGKLSDHYYVAPKFTKDSVLLSVQAKHPDAHLIEPLTGSGTFVFPDTPEGKAMVEAMRRHVTTGEPVTLRGVRIKDFKPPAPLAPLLHIDDSTLAEVRVGPRTSPDPLVVDLVIDADDGDTATLHNVDLRRVLFGTEQITLNNHHQAVPWRVELVINFVTLRFDVNFGADYKGVNVKRELEGLRFQRVSAKGGIFRLVQVSSGLSAGSGRFPAAAVTGPDDRFIRLLEALVLIQARTGTALMLPEGDVTREQALTILSTAQIVETGEYTESEEGSLDVDIERTPEALRNALETFGDGHGHAIRWSHGNETRIICGVSISLGSVELDFERVLLPPESVAVLRAALEEQGDGGPVAVQLVMAPGTTAVARYAKWLPPGAAPAPEPDEG